mgnify:CR=1
IALLEKVFFNKKYKFNIYSNIKNIEGLKNTIFAKNQSDNNFNLELFITVDQRLINFDFNKYSIKSFKKLDELDKSKILDY